MTDKQDKKILPIDRWRRDKADGLNEEDSLEPLLNHMRKIRENVPVNNDLKEELRQKLFKKKNGAPKNIQEVRQKPFIFSLNKGVKVTGLVIAFILVIFFMLQQQVGNVKKLTVAGGIQEVTRYWAEEEQLKPALSVDGKNLLATRGGALLWLNQNGIQYTLLKPEKGESYHSPTWSPDGKKITLVKRTKEGNEDIIQYQAAFLSKETKNTSILLERFAKQQPEVLYQGQDGEKINNLHWSPKGNYLAYILKLPQKASVVVLLDANKESQQIGIGTDLTWSPNSTKLVVERLKKDPQLWLISTDGKQEELLGNGQNPVWSPQGYLVFTAMKFQERILTYLPDGTSQFTVQQRVGEIRSIYLGANGEEVLQKLKEGQSVLAQSNLLISLNDEKSLTELEWLRKLESEGVREPRVLLLDEVEQNISRCFGPEGRSLYLTKESRGMVSILRVELQERMEKRGEQ